MAHENGTVVADEVLPVAEACGQSVEQVRSCLRRLVQEGLFRREGRGTDAMWKRRPRLGEAGFFAGGLSVRGEFSELFGDDRMVPPGLLRSSWPGRAAREVLGRSRRRALLLREPPNRPGLFRSFADLV